jgi:N-acetylmuramoyl-L-alanine amidase
MKAYKKSILHFNMKYLSILLPSAPQFLLLFLLSIPSHAALTNKFIGIDPGHGGSDPGTSGPTGLTEKETALAISLATQKYLRRDGADVAMTRSTDTRISLTARTNYLNSNNVDRVVSVHLNSVGTPSVNRTMDFVYCGFCNSISGNVAEWVLNEVSSVTGLNKGPASSVLCPGRTDNNCAGKPGVGQANLHMVRETSMSAILSEIAFISNPAEENKLRNAAYIDTIGWAIYAGIAKHFGTTPLPKDNLGEGDAFEPDNNSSQATSIKQGSSQQHHSILPANDEDWMTFTLSETADVTIETSGASGDTVMFLYSSNLTLITQNDDADGTLFSLIKHRLPPGNYFIKIIELGQNHVIPDYSVSLTVTNRDTGAIMVPILDLLLQ